MGRWEIHTGECLQAVKAMPANSVDAVVTDPPYGLAFMGKRWDYDLPSVDLWKEVFRVLKPGGHLLAFGGARTYHRAACRIEDAGFEIRDCIMWIYGSGFPKNLSVSKAIDKAEGRENVVGVKPDRWTGKGNSLNFSTDRPQTECKITAPATEAAQQWDGWGTALKPSHEPIVLARKPLRGTVAENVQAWGVGALNVNGCRIEPTGESQEREAEASQGRRYDKMGSTNFAALPSARGGNSLGRWPANVIHDGSDEVRSFFPSAPGQMAMVDGSEPSAKTGEIYGKFSGNRPPAFPRSNRDTSAARFFYCAKVDRAERDAGCEGVKVKPLNWSSGVQNPGSFQSDGTNRNARNCHPTVKPISLMRYLCRLVTPPDGLVLDPFMGSGTTGCAALLEGFRFIGIEREPDYAEIARRRIAHWADENQLPLFAGGTPDAD